MIRHAAEAGWTPGPLKDALSMWVVSTTCRLRFRRRLTSSAVPGIPRVRECPDPGRSRCGLVQVGPELPRPDGADAVGGVLVLTVTESSVPRMRGVEAPDTGGVPWSGTRPTTGSFKSSPNASACIQKVWGGDARASITVPARTLLDGRLVHAPFYCGNCAAVLHAFQVGLDRLNIERLAFTRSV